MKTYTIVIESYDDSFKTEMRLSEVEYSIIKTLLDMVLMNSEMYANIEELEE